jgi:hypothetical protein
VNGFANAGAFLELRLRGIDYDKDRNVAQHLLGAGACALTGAVSSPG